MESFRHELSFEEAISFGEWGLHIMDAFCENPDMISSCRGFTRDMYKYMIGACLNAEEYEKAASLYHDLEAKMDLHFNHYRGVLSDENEMQKYDANILRYITAYTPEFIDTKKKEILYQLKEWYGEDKFSVFKSKLS